MSVFAGIETAARDVVVEDLIGLRRAWSHASPSQIKRFRECASAWYLESVLSFPRRETAATRKGKEMHAELEVYLRDAKPPGPLASAGLAYLPTPPIDAELVEVPLAIRAPGLPPIVAKIDLVDPDRPTTIIDHKSTSSIAKYAKGEDELRSDPQAIIYAVALAPTFAALAGGKLPAPAETYTTPTRAGRDVETYPGVALELEALDAIPEGIRFEHVYYQTSPIRSDRSSVILSPDDVRQGWRRVEDTVRAMARTAELEHVSEVPHSVDACGKYGGCQFRQLCAGLGRRTMGVASNFYTDPGFARTSEGLTMGIMESLARRKAEQSAAQAGDTSPAVPADPFAVGQKAIEAARAAAVSPPPTPAEEDDDEAELLRQIEARRAAKRAAAEAEAKRLKAERIEADRLEVERLEAERAAEAARLAAEAEAKRLEAERAATRAPETAAEDDDEAELLRQIEARRAAKRAAAELPSVNPPDGLPNGAPLPETETPDKPGDPVIPKLPEVPAAFAGVRLRSVKKEPMIELFDALRKGCAAKGLVCPEGVAHLWNAPTAGLAEAKRTAIKYACEVAIALLQGKPIPARDASDDEGAPASSSPPPSAPASSSPPPSAPASSSPAPRSVPSEVLETPAPSGALPRFLFVGCAPRRLPVVYLSELLEPLIKAAEAELGVQHYRIPQYKRGFDAVIARLAYALRNGEIVPPEALVVEPHLPLSAEALPELLPHYDVVVERMG